MLIEVLNSKDKINVSKWNDFVFSCRSATFFHRAEWQEVIRQNFGHDTYFIYCVSGEEVIGILPLVHIKSRIFGTSLVSLPFGVYGGLATDSPLAEADLINEAHKLAYRLRVDVLEYRNVSQKNAHWATQGLYHTFRKELSCDDSVNLAGIPRKQRAMVRKGMSSGLSVMVDRDVQTFYALYADNMHRHGSPSLPKNFFKNVLEVFGSDCDILTVVDLAGRPVSTVMSFYFKNEILPYYAGDTVHARLYAANDFKYWELMRHAVKKRIKIFDFGRSKSGTGSFKFKKNWGFEPQQLCYEYCLLGRKLIPQNNPSNKKFDMLIRTWRLLPKSVVDALGPHLVKSLS